MNREVQIIKDKARMCDSIQCYECQIGIEAKDMACIDFTLKNPERVVEVVKNWSKKNPEGKDTYLWDLLQKYPNIKRYDDGTPMACREFLYGIPCPKPAHTLIGKGGKDCVGCWNERINHSK